MGNMDYELISFQTAVTDIEDIIRQARTTAYQSVSVPCTLNRQNRPLHLCFQHLPVC